MPENPFKPHTKIEQSDPRANEKLVTELLSGQEAAVYAKLNENTAEPLAGDLAGHALNKEEKEGVNEAKLLTSKKMIRIIKESGSPAILDTFFEGGVVPVTTSLELREALKDFSSAKMAYASADNGSLSNMAPGLNKMPLLPLDSFNFNTIILSHSKESSLQMTLEDTLTDIDNLDLRPATFAELIALAIVKPEFNKRSEYLIALGTTAAVKEDVLYFPILGWDGRTRLLTWGQWTGGWSSRRRLVCVPK